MANDNVSIKIFILSRYNNMSKKRWIEIWNNWWPCIQDKVWDGVVDKDCHAKQCSIVRLSI
jgi:hypothetical protein